ncbi:hypothetical protein DFH29DRAFT_890017 [Suillus ampliporus]|nr:hypothetical protein DFH29DRAFT_890017 [Suillus ampliporus]
MRRVCSICASMILVSTQGARTTLPRIFLSLKMTTFHHLTPTGWPPKLLWNLSLQGRGTPSKRGYNPLLLLPEGAQYAWDTVTQCQ